MDRNFPRALELVLKHEGGYVDHPSDPGGATNLGITIGTLTAWLGHAATKADVKALTRADVAPIYRKRFWDVIEGDELPDGLDYAVFDYAVNSGPGRAAKHLQELIGVPADGKIGPVTLAAVNERNPRDLIEALCQRRLKFLKGLGTWPVFGKGWNSRVNGVLSDALLMAVAPPAAPLPIDTPDEPARIPVEAADTGDSGPIVIAFIALLLLAGIAIAVTKALNLF